MQHVKLCSNLIAEDYGWAIIHLAWWRKEAQRQLVFGYIELLPTEFPEPSASAELDIKTAKFAARSDLNYKRFVTRADEAIEWYERYAVSQEKTSLPMSGDKLLEAGNFEAEPTWGQTNYIADLANTLPFLGNQWGPVRAHSSYSKTLAPDIRQVREYSAFTSWLSERFLFDFEAYPLLWGSLHLVAPNPVVRHMKVLLARKEDGNECVDVQIIPRHEYTVDSLTLVYEETGPNGIINSQVIPLRDPPLRLEHGSQDVAQSTISIYCKDRGLLISEGPYAFLKHIDLKMNIVTGRKDISVPAKGKKKPSYNYQVPITGADIQTMVGESSDHGDIRSQLYREKSRQKSRSLAQNLDQKWFHGQQSEAETFVRKQIQQARIRVWLIDPYFAVREFFAFALAVERHDVQISILSSAEALKSIDDGQTETCGQVFKNQLDHIATKISNPIDVRVMTGNRPIIHDRFLVLDSTVWLSGISLNEIGSRAGMMIKLPDPAPVINALQSIWGNAERVKPLSEWLSQKK